MEEKSAEKKVVVGPFGRWFLTFVALWPLVFLALLTSLNAVSDPHQGLGALGMFYGSIILSCGSSFVLAILLVVFVDPSHIAQMFVMAYLAVFILALGVWFYWGKVHA